MVEGEDCMTYTVLAVCSINTEGCVVVQWLALLSHSTKISDFSRIIGVLVKVCDCLC